MYTDSHKGNGTHVQNNLLLMYFKDGCSLPVSPPHLIALKYMWQRFFDRLINSIFKHRCYIREDSP